MVQPTLNTDVYDAISPKNFVGHFSGKLVIVTGAGRGIGRHVALGFAKAGATLALLDFEILHAKKRLNLSARKKVRKYILMVVMSRSMDNV